MHLLDEKTDSVWYIGSGNLGILFSADGKELLNFSTGKLVFSENKVKDRKWLYNSLVGPNLYPGFAEEIC